MSKTRPFSFKIHAAELFSAVQKIPMKQRAEFITQFATDLITLEPVTEYGKHVVEETANFIKKQSEYGKSGGKPKHREPIGSLKGALVDPTEKTKPEVKEEVKEKNILQQRVSDLFEKLWTAYPRKDGRKAAERHYFATVKNENDMEQIDIALGNYLDHIEKNDIKHQFIKTGSTWFNNWADWKAT